jgi:hypothetical protein
LKTALEKHESDKLVRGVSPGDILMWLYYVQRVNLEERDIKLGFKWKPLKPRGGFSVRNIHRDILRKDGNYVLIGAAKRKNMIWYALMTRLGGGKKPKNRKKGKVKKIEVKKELSEEKKLEIYAVVADDIKRSKCDHAMGLQVKDGVATCFNNGYKDGKAKFSVDNLASQMIGLKACYYIALYKVDE